MNITDSNYVNSLQKKPGSQECSDWSNTFPKWTQLQTKCNPLLGETVICGSLSFWKTRQTNACVILVCVPSCMMEARDQTPQQIGTPEISWNRSMSQRNHPTVTIIKANTYCLLQTRKPHVTDMKFFKQTALFPDNLRIGLDICTRLPPACWWLAVIEFWLRSPTRPTIRIELQGSILSNRQREELKHC